MDDEGGHRFEMVNEGIIQIHEDSTDICHKKQKLINKLDHHKKDLTMQNAIQ